MGIIRATRDRATCGNIYVRLKSTWPHIDIESCGADGSHPTILYDAPCVTRRSRAIRDVATRVKVLPTGIIRATRGRERATTNLGAADGYHPRNTGSRNVRPYIRAACIRDTYSSHPLRTPSQHVYTKYVVAHRHDIMRCRCVPPHNIIGYGMCKKGQPMGSAHANSGCGDRSKGAADRYHPLNT